jgi:putative DNA primase/helicase
MSVTPLADHSTLAPYAATPMQLPLLEIADNRDVGASSPAPVSAPSGIADTPALVPDDTTPSAEPSGRAVDTPDGEPHLTDVGNAQRFVRDHGQDVRYVHAWDSWLSYQDGYWAKDESGEVVERAKATVARLFEEVAALQDEVRATKALLDGCSEHNQVQREIGGDLHECQQRLRALETFAEQSESDHRLRAMLHLAQSAHGIPVRPDALDCDPMLLAVPNGVIDLHTGTLRQSQREDLITRLAPVYYDPDATCPRWEAFLAQIMAGDAELVGFLQRAIGYSLTGGTSERAMFILHGQGRNGKSTVLEIIRQLLGHYALRTPTETLLPKRDGAIPNDVARLRGARFVTASETDEGRRLSEAFVKELTGGDVVSARFLRGEWFDFRPICKIWLSTNHRPEIRGTDPAIWDRLRLIPFGVRVWDPDLDGPAPSTGPVVDKTLLATLQSELPGILNWAIAGCLAWQQDGLSTPVAVRAATAGYRRDMDIVGQFLKQCCVQEPLGRVQVKVLHDAYTQWCAEVGESPLTRRKLGERLRERGFPEPQRGTGNVMYHHGLSLLDTPVKIASRSSAA